MNIDRVVQAVDDRVSEREGKPLKKVERLILRGSLEGKTYEQIAKESRYSLTYLKQATGPQLWKKLTEVFGENISKTNIQVTLNQHPDLRKTTEVTQLNIDRVSDARNSIDSNIKPTYKQSKTSFYVERPPVESSCYEAISQPGSLIRIRSPRRMGKTWLMERIFQHALEQDYRIAPLNLLQPEREVVDNLDKFLRWLCSIVSRRLGVENEVDRAWSERRGSNDNCTAYFENYILQETGPDLVLGLDNVDRIFQHENIAKDFFGLLRSWHEDAQIYKPWKNLRLVIAYSREVYIPLNIERSPFNVGLPISLPEFTQAQVQKLLGIHQLNWNEAQIDRLMEMLGGHPYLLNCSIEFLKSHDGEREFYQFLEKAPTDAGLYRNHLRELLYTLQKEPGLEDAMYEVIQADNPVQLNPNQSFKLYSLGLAIWKGNKVEPRCQLYRSYFKTHLKLLSQKQTDSNKLSRIEE